MRAKLDPQCRLDFSRPTLKLTDKYYQRYEAISNILQDNPKVLNAVHRDLQEPLRYTGADTHEGTHYRFTSENVLRILIVMILEAMSLRRVVVLIDDSDFLRRFTRIHDGAMMDYTTLDKLKNSVRPRTWKRVNQLLANHAVAAERIEGDRLRIDTTAVPTNIHHPTDSSLLWDGFRSLAGLIRKARTLDRDAAGARRLHLRRAKKRYQKISRLAGKKKSWERMKPQYEGLIAQTEGICNWAERIVKALKDGRQETRYGDRDGQVALLVERFDHVIPLVRRVVDQSARRVLCGEQVPNDEKLFSIFEEHTELLKRGKSWASIEYGHMIQIQQVPSKFITDYEVFAKKPDEPSLLKPVVESHKQLFGRYPEIISADKGYSRGQDIAALESKGIRVAIGKKGRTITEEDRQREHAVDFSLAQRFRAGIEGTISFLKRGLGLYRCLNRGWANFESTVGMTIFCHNLLKLAAT